MYVRRLTKMSAIRWKVPVTAKIIAVLLSAALAGSTAVVDEVEDMLGDCVKDAAHVRIREKTVTEAKKKPRISGVGTFRSEGICAIF